MRSPHITREYIESLSVENARTLMQVLGAQYDEIIGMGTSIAENVTHNIDFATKYVAQAEASNVIY